MTAIATSPDGQWIAVQRGTELVLLGAAGGAPLGQMALAGDDVDLAFAGPPSLLVTATRVGSATHVAMYQPPNLELLARLELERPTRIAAVTGQRLALIAADGKHAIIARAAGKALATQTVDVGAAVEFAVGLERNQLLFSLPRKLEVWDAVSGRPMLKMQLQLPPAPRTVGIAAGHVWATRPNSDEVFIYRLSDGRPFRHNCGSPVLDVIGHPMSPIVVVVTAGGLLRLHCFAHSLTIIDGTPFQGEPMPLAQLVANEDIQLIGLADGWSEPWRVPISGPAAAPEATDDKARDDKPRVTPPASTAPAALRAPELASRAAGKSKWREALAAYGAEVVKGSDSEVPVAPADSELGELAQRLGLSAQAKRTMIALYAVHLVGEPALSIARLAKIAGDWTEPLGQGELAAFAMLDREHGKVALRTAVADVLDGAKPRAIRLVGGAAGMPKAGAFRMSRDGRTDQEIEAALAAQLGRIGVVEGDLPTALLEARLHGATAVALTAPATQPRPWPLEAGLVLVLPGAPSSWLADLPALEASA